VDDELAVGGPRVRLAASLSWELGVGGERKEEVEEEVEVEKGIGIGTLGRVWCSGALYTDVGKKKAAWVREGEEEVAEEEVEQLESKCFDGCVWGHLV